MVIHYKLFDLYTQKYIQKTPDEYLEEDVTGSLLEMILPPEAKNKLSLASIEMGMDEEMVSNNHPEPDNNVLLLNRGDRGLYGPPEYKQLIEPYLDTIKDYPYHRYLSNENQKVLTQAVKIWVIDDEQGVSGIDSVTNEQAQTILGDSHGKISLNLAKELVSDQGETTQLIQHRMLGIDTPFFAKGTFQAGLANTLKKHGLENNTELAQIDIILPTSSIKGASKSNLLPGVHTVQVHLSNHKESVINNYTMRAVTEKLANDSFAWAVKRQEVEINKLNQTFTNSEALFAEYIKFIEPKVNADGTPFDPQKWEESGRWEYITARRDYESGHYQLLTSNVYSAQMNDFYASRARGAAELEFVKVRGGMIYCSHELTNNEICVPSLAEGEDVAAVRSPIINLQDIAIVKNRHIRDMYNDEGKLMQGAIICSPQMYESLMNQSRNFVTEQTKKLEAAGIDVTYLSQLNAFEKLGDNSLKTLEGVERQEFIEQMNAWREVYNSLVEAQKLDNPNLQKLEPIRLDTFTAILAADFDGDNIAIVPRSQYPELVAGIEERIAEADSYTVKLDKIKVDGNENLASILARKADPFIVGKTANLTEQLQSLALESQRILNQGDKGTKLDYLTKIAPTFYYLLSQPTGEEYNQAEAAKLRATYRDYTVTSTDTPLIKPKLVAQFDVYGLNKELPSILNGNGMGESEINRALELWQAVLLDINQKIALENQIAVDSFKSERSVDNELVEGLTRRFGFLNDGLKKALDDRESYRQQIPTINNGATNRSLLVHNVNQNLTRFQLESSSYDRIQNLFPKLTEDNSQNTDILHQTTNATNEYKRYRQLNRRYRDKATNDNGPSLVFTHNNRQIEVSNLLSSNNSPQAIRKRLELSNQPLELRIQANQKTGAAHPFVVAYKAEQDKWKVLGTLCNACQSMYDLKEEELGKIDKFDFVTPNGQHLAKVYKQQQDKVVSDFLAAIPPDQIDLYAAATYQTLTNSDSKQNNLAFMFAAFGEKMAEAVQNFKLKDLKLHSLAVDKIPQGEISVLIDRDSEQQKKFAVYLTQETGEVSKVGIISDDSFHPRLGAQAKAQINYQNPSVGTFTLENGLTFSAGKMDSLDAAGEIFSEKELEIEIAPGKGKPQAILQLNGQTLGLIAQNSANKLALDGLLNAGQEIVLNLTSNGIGKGKKITGTALNGKDSFDIVQSYFYAPKALKERVFKQEEFKLTVGFRESKADLNVYAYRNGKRESIASLDSNKYKDDVKKVTTAGLIGKKIKAKVNSKLSTIKVSLDPATITYPKEAVNLFLEQDTAKLSTENNPTTDYLLDNARSYSSIFHYQQRDWLDSNGDVVKVPSIDVLVDVSSPVLSQHEDYLTELGFQQVSASDPQIALETRKGFVVYTLPADKIRLEDEYSLKKQLNVRHVFDESTSADASAKFNSLLTKQFRDYRASLNNEQINNEQINNQELLLNQTGQLEQMSIFLPSELPQLSFVPEISQALPPTYKLVELLKTHGLLSDLEVLKIANTFDRHDYQWLNSQLDNPVKTPEAVVTVLNSDKLPQLQNLVKDFITPEGELIYLHQQNATDKRYAEELITVIGQKKYQLLAADTNRIQSEKIKPIVVKPESVASFAGSLAIKRLENYQVPLPENLKRGVAFPITLGVENNPLSMALSYPDAQNADTNYPLTFDNQEYPSIQAAYKATVDKIPFQQRYQHAKELLTAKLIQHPEIVQTITRMGGKTWLSQNSFQNSNDFMSGKGKDSGWVRGTILAYEQALAVIDKQSQEVITKESKPVQTTVTLTLEADGAYQGSNISSRNTQDSLYGNDHFWEGNGLNSGFIKALTQAYEQVIERDPSLVVPVKAPKPQVSSPVKTQTVTGATTRSHSAKLDIKGSPIKMDFPLFLYDQPNPLPVDNCFEAMRGHGRIHTTRNFEPYKAYKIKEGDLAVAFKGDKENPSGQILLRIGKQAKFKQEWINDPEFQKRWAEREKHAPQALPNLFNKKLAQGGEVWGLQFEPLGDLIDGKVYDFQTGKEINLTHISTEPGGELKDAPSPDISTLPEVQSKTQPLVEEDISSQPGVQLKGAPPADISLLSGIQRNNDEVLKDKNNLTATSKENKPLPKAFLNLRFGEPSSYENAKLTIDSGELLKNSVKEIIQASGLKAAVTPSIAINDTEAVGSFLATFTDASDLSSVYYNAAQLGLKFDRDNVSFFVEEADGSDKMYGVTVNESIDEVRATLEMLGIDKYTLIPTAGQTKIVVFESAGTQSHLIQDVQDHYGQMSEYSGKLHLLQRDRFIEVGEKYNSTTQTAQLTPLEKLQNHLSDPILLKLTAKASKFIGFNPGQKSEMKAMISAWGEQGNSTNYLAEDKVMIVGQTLKDVDNSVKLKESFEKEYKPLLDKVIASKAKVMLTNNPGVDRLVAKYLEAAGYTLKDTGKGYSLAWDKTHETNKETNKTTNLTALTTDIKTAKQIQQEQVNVVAPLIAQILQNAKSYELQTNKYDLSYIQESMNLLLSDRSNGELKMSAVFNKEAQTWDSTTSTHTLSPEIVNDLRSMLEKPSISLPGATISPSNQPKNFFLKGSSTQASQSFRQQKER